MLINAAREPEIVDLGDCLVAMGAKISGLGTSKIVVEGVNSLHGAEHCVLADRIETGTYAMAAAIAGGDIELVGTKAGLVQSVVTLLQSIGTEITETNRGLKVYRQRRQAVDRRRSHERLFRVSRPICRRSSWR